MGSKRNLKFTKQNILSFFALFSLLLTFVQPLSITRVSALNWDPVKWLACSLGDSGETVLKAARTEWIWFLWDSKSAIATTDNSNYDLPSGILKVSGYKFGTSESSESANNPFDYYGMLGLKYTSYKGEWKYYEVDVCKDNADQQAKSTNYGQFYTDRKEPIASYSERYSSVDNRVIESTKGWTSAIWKSLGDRFSNVILFFTKITVSITLALISLSFTDIGSLMGLDNKFQESMFLQLYNNFFTPLVMMMVLLTAGYIAYYGLIKREFRTAVVNGMLKTFLSFFIAILIGLNPSFVTIPNKLATMGQLVMVSALGEGVKGDGADDLCQASGDWSTSKAFGKENFLETAGDGMRSILGCRMWAEYLFKPFVMAQFGTEYKDLNSLSNLNKSWVGEPTVNIGSNTITNWGLFHISIMSGLHETIDEVSSPLVGGVNKDFYRIVDALANYEEDGEFKLGRVRGPGGGSSSGSSGGGDEFFLSEEKMEENAKKIYSVLKTWGLNDNQIAGVLGNFQKESSLNPKLVESIYVGYVVPNVVEEINKNGPLAEVMFTVNPRVAIERAGGNPDLYRCNFNGKTSHCMGTGLGQWTAQPVEAMFNFAKKKNMKLLDLDFQLVWMMSNMPNDFSYHQRLIRYSKLPASSPSEAAQNFLNNWEYGAGSWNTSNAPSGSTVDVPLRMQHAEKWAKKIKTWSVDKSYADKILKQAESTGDVGSPGSSSSSSSGGGSGGGDIEEYATPQDNPPLKEWAYWNGSKQGHRLGYTFIMALFAAIGSIAPLILAFTATILGIGITLLSIISPIFLLLGCWGGKGNQIFKQYIGTLLSTIIKKVVVTALLIITVVIMSSVMEFLNKEGFFKSLIYLLILTFAIIKNKDRILSKLSQVNFGQLNTEHFTNSVKKISGTIRNTAGVAVGAVSGGIASKQNGGTFKRGAYAGISSTIKNNMYKSDVGRRAMTTYETSKKNSRTQGFGDKHYCVMCNKLLKEDTDVWVDGNNNYFCEDCASLEGYEGMVETVLDNEYENTQSITRNESREITTLDGETRTAKHLSYEDIYSSPEMLSIINNNNNSFNPIEDERSYTDPRESKELLLKHIEDSMLIVSEDLYDIEKNNGVIDKRFIPEPIVPFVDAAKLQKAVLNSQKNLSYYNDEYFKIIEEGWKQWFITTSKNADLGEEKSIEELFNSHSVAWQKHRKNRKDLLKNYQNDKKD